MGCSGGGAANNSSPNTAPTVFITAPASGAIVSGTITISTSVSSNTTSVQFQVDGKNTGAAVTSAPFSYALNTTTLSNGSHALTAIASSAAAQTTTSAAVSINVNNSTSAAPTITITSPASGATVSGTITISTSVSANTTSVQFQVDGNNTGAAVTSVPFSFSLNTTSLSNGAHVLTAVASNAAGQTATSAPVSISVNNSTLVIATTNLPSGQVQVSYSATLQATGGTAPYSWSIVSGQLPTGLTLSSGGVISGTPTTAGQFTSTIQVLDAAAQTASNAFTITVSMTGTMPQFGHVFIVVGENQAYGTTYNSSNMPYLTSLANQYGLATNYWADTHPSIGNYEVFTAGQIFTNDDGQTPSSMPLSSDNIAFEVQQAGKTWKDYVETKNGCGALNSGSYYVRHDPLQYFTNINTQSANFVCFSQFATDLANHTLPNLSWLVPNGCDDAHDCSVGTFDTWLQSEIGPLLASSYFQPGGDGLLIITWDEDDTSGSPSCSTTTVGLGCGGQIETVMISPLSKLAYKSTAGDPANFNSTYDGANLLRTIADALGVKTSGLGGAATRVPMADFF